MKQPDGILGRIIARKLEEVAAARATRSRAELDAAAASAPPIRELAEALRRPHGAPMHVLAEVKRASPSAGPIRPGADPAGIAADYERYGAKAISVLTDRDFFDGDLAFLAACRAATTVPLLRKDFILGGDDGAYQLVEARAAGADAVLLIAAVLELGELRALLGQVAALGMQALVEAHDLVEAQTAVDAGALIIGVNHRDLRTFTMDMTLTAQVAPRLPRGTVLVAESGIRTPGDIAAMLAAGADAVLVGEALMRQPSPGHALAALLDGP